MSRIHYSECPVCSSRSIDPLLTVKDHSVSGEEYVIWQCRNCALRFTQDVPDEASIGDYYKSENYISHTNTDKGLVNRLYKKVRKITLKAKGDLIAGETVSRGKLLDVGAGTGAFARHMQDRGWQVVAIEPDGGAREKAKSDFGIAAGDASELMELPAGSFDAISLWHVLEHVHDLHAYIERLKELLKPGGKIFIAVPNYTAVDADIYKTYWAAYDVPRHLYHFSPASIQSLLNQHGLILKETRPMWFDSFYISLLSSGYKGSRIPWLGAVLSGIRSNFFALLDRKKCSSLIYIIGKA